RGLGRPQTPSPGDGAETRRVVASPRMKMQRFRRIWIAVAIASACGRSTIENGDAPDSGRAGASTNASGGRPGTESGGAAGSAAPTRPAPDVAGSSGTASSGGTSGGESAGGQAGEEQVAEGGALTGGEGGSASEELGPCPNPMVFV